MTASNPPPRDDWKPLGRTGFLIRPEPTPAEAAFLDTVALYAAAAASNAGIADIRRHVVSLVDRYQLGHLRDRALTRAVDALPESLRIFWNRSP